MILAVGEILFDIFPEYKRLGGAPFNFAAHIKNFGYETHFISRVGDDKEGDEIKSYLTDIGFNAGYIQTDEHSTGKVIVTLDENGIPEYEIITGVAYDFISYDDSVAGLMGNNPEMIYTGTLIQRSENGYKTIQKLLKNKGNTVCFYDINLRPGCYNKEIIESTLKFTNILKLNHEELLTLNEILNIPGNEKDFVRDIFKKYPVEMLAITRGEDGSSIYSEKDVHTVSGDQHPDIVDTVGAGDAFASIVAIGYLRSWDISKINTAASGFASAICGIKGAIPEDRNVYNEFRKLF